jgi:8-oxo-dGTP diphosphatase
MMKDRKAKARTPILAAGGIVLRNDRGLAPQFAVIQSRKLQTWGLPKGKLAAGEDAMTAARREVLEETGHHVTVHEFLGTLVYETSSRSKVVQFWRMAAAGAPAGDLMRDVMAVDWLTLPDAIGRLSHIRERLFLEQVGPIALKLARQPESFAPDILEPEIRVQSVPLAPAAGTSLPDDTDEAVKGVVVKDLAPAGQDHALAVQTAAPVGEEMGQPGKDSAGKEFTGKGKAKKTWGWFRHAAWWTGNISIEH